MLDPKNEGFLDRSKLVDVFRDLLYWKLRVKYKNKPEQWYKDRIETFASNMADVFIPERPGNPAQLRMSVNDHVGIDHAEFVKASTFSDPLDWDDLLKLAEDDDGPQRQPRGRRLPAFCGRRGHAD